LAGADERVRGKGIARPERPREPKQSWRAQAPHAWMWAVATARQVCWAADSEQALSRLAWVPAVPTGPLRPRSPGCRLARRSGHLVRAGTRAAHCRPERHSCLRRPVCHREAELSSRRGLPLDRQASERSLEWRLVGVRIAGAHRESHRTPRLRRRHPPPVVYGCEPPVMRWWIAIRTVAFRPNPTAVWMLLVCRQCDALKCGRARRGGR
jgi:hypothetical protein